MKNYFEVNTKMDFLTYVQMVEDIVSEYFDADGIFSPHIGRAYVMKAFYDQCVKSSELEVMIGDAANTIDVVNILASHSTFMREFAQIMSTNEFAFDFANAYKDAMAVIEDKKSSVSRLVNVCEKAIEELMEKVMPALTNENLAAVRAITENMTGGKTTAEAIVDEYIKSERLKTIVNMKDNASE